MGEVRGEVMIKVLELSKSFGSLEVLRDVSLTVERGERIAIIGGSGCGKSVFLRLIELLERPDAGHVHIAGEEISARGADVNRIRRKAGMVFQQFNLFSNMDVMDNITLAPMRLLGIPRGEAEARATELLRTVGLEGRAHDMPSVLSGGQRQRVAIARCLAMDPEVMLFDEPTSALDPTMVGEVLATIRMLAKRDMTMLVVAHEMAFAREVATRVVFFAEKGIYEQGTPDEVFDSPKRPLTQAFVRKMKFFSQHIDAREFDLMSLQSGLRLFSERYGMPLREAQRLELCSEELIFEMLDNSVAPGEPVDLDLSVEYSEAERTVLLRCDSAGTRYYPFDAPDDGGVHLGVTILRNVAREISYTYEGGRNHIGITL